MSYVKINGANELNAYSLFRIYNAAAPSLICLKVRGWSTVTAAVSVAANEVVVELTNMSFAIFIVF